MTTISAGAAKCRDPVALNLWHPVGAVVELPPGIVHETRLLEEEVCYDVAMSDGGFEVQINPDYSAASISAGAMELFETRLQEVIDGTFEVPLIGSAEE